MQTQISHIFPMDSALISRLYNRLFLRKSTPSKSIPAPQRYKRTLRSRHKPQFSLSNPPSFSPPAAHRSRNSPSFPHSVSPPRREERIMYLEARIKEKEERYRKIQARYQLLLMQHSAGTTYMISPTKQLIRGILNELESLQSSAEVVEAHLRQAESSEQPVERK